MNKLLAAPAATILLIAMTLPGLASAEGVLNANTASAEELAALPHMDEVLAEMRVALELRPDNPMAHLLKGEALFHLKRFDQFVELHASDWTPEIEVVGVIVSKPLIEQAEPMRLQRFSFFAALAGQVGGPTVKADIELVAEIEFFQCLPVNPALLGHVRIDKVDAQFVSTR